MCCSCAVSPVIKGTAESILALGMFTPGPGPTLDGPLVWEREVREEDGKKYTVKAWVEGDVLKLDIWPRIHKLAEHGRVSGGVYLEVACKVAEKCGSKIVQSSNVMECVENSDRTKLLADYGAGQALDWGAVCVGFQTAILPAPEDGGIAYA